MVQVVQQGFTAGRILATIMGFLFAGIGVTVLIFLWSFDAHDFGAPPLFFRIFGSFIALGFVAFGSPMGITGLLAKGVSLGKAMPGPMPDTEAARGEETPAEPTAGVGYCCSKCGAPLAKGAEVSPLGDVKCTFCGAWFNIHGRQS